VRYPSPRWTAPVLLCILLFVCILIPPASATVHNVKTECGAVGNGSNDDTAAINACISRLGPGDTLLFPAGTYKIGGSLNAITDDNVTVDGSNSTATIKAGTSGITLLTVGAQSLSASTPLTAASAELDNTVNANWSAIGVVGGSYVYIEEGTTSGHLCGDSGCRGEVVKVQSVNSNVATLTTAVHQLYDASCCAAWVKKLLNPVSGVTIQNINLDGSGTASYGLAALNAVNLTVSGLNSSHVTLGAIAAVNGFNQSYNNITITHAGSNTGGSIGGSAFSLAQQGSPTVNGVTISSLNSFGFGFIPFRLGGGTFSNISVDGAGTGGGRPFKTNSTAYNTFNSITIHHAEGASYNGLTIEYFSAHNTWNNCVITNMGGSDNAAVSMYGDTNGAQQGSNHYNTFNNCTISAPVNEYAFRNIDHNDHMEINGGTFSGISGSSVIVVGERGLSTNAYIHNVTISTGSVGVNLITSSNGCITSNSLSGVSNTISSGSSTNVGSGNSPNNGDLTVGSCGSGSSSAPAAPTGLTATVN